MKMDRITNKDIQTTLEQINHPVIDCNIVELGMIKNINFDNSTAIITVVFPFIGVPVKDLPVREQIIRLITEAVENLGLKVEINTIEMSKEELQVFLEKERETWERLKQWKFTC
jgi:metal-sulfur cluster biosynthetic enzyme